MAKTRTIETVESACSGSIPRSAVVRRQGPGGKMLDYIDQAYVINRLNEVFGPMGWETLTPLLDRVVLESFTDTYGKEKYRCTYTALVGLRVSVDSPKDDSFCSVTHWDTGTGHGIAGTAGDAIESASKEAVTDALKRCARKLGQSFGMSLYDKGHYSADSIVERIAACTTLEALEVQGDDIKRLSAEERLSRSEVATLKAAFIEKKSTLTA